MGVPYDPDPRPVNRKLWVFALLPLGAVLGVFILPYGASLSGALGGAGWGRISASSILPTAVFTLKQALASTLAALVLGLPGAWFLEKREGPVSRVLWVVCAVPFALPSILVVLGFVLFFGNAGWLNRLAMALTGAKEGPLHILYTQEALVLAHGFYNFPLVIRLVGDGVHRVRRAYAPAAASLGASPMRTALTVLFPLLMPSIMAASLMVFLYSFTSFAVVLVLGGGPRATTLAVEIYRYARLSLDFEKAGVLALLETAIAGAAFGGYVFFARKARSVCPDIADRPLEGRERAPFAVVRILYCLGVLGLVLGPVLAILGESVLVRTSFAAAPRLDLKWWYALGDRSLPALGRSLVLAFCSASFACVLALFAAGLEKYAGGGSGASFLGTALQAGCTAPLASSGIVLGLGWLSLYGREQARSIAAVVVIHGVSGLPFAYHALAQGLRSVPANTLHAAAVSGVGPIGQMLTVALPLSARRLRSAWGFAAALSLGELNAVMMVGLEDWETLPLLIYRAVGAYRYGTACAAGVLLILCCGCFFWVSGESSRDSVKSQDNHGKTYVP
ncbi:MAG: iron ABC transporter permease [Spirochaetaceae bacterium]|jgi:thiamine transport system permease protein|nr:iron ABC transporter permease [Spirochaetaceae bacterium]